MHENPDYADQLLTWLDLFEVNQDQARFLKQVASVEARGVSAGKRRYFLAVAACHQHLLAEQRFYLEGQSGEALIDLAVMQLMGEGGLVDEEEGIRNLLEAAQYKPHAQYILSQLFANGLHGVTKDPVRARNLLVAAAQKGQPDAVRELAVSARPGK